MRRERRDRAFIDCHFEAETRPGEILNLQIRHVKFDQYGVVLNVDGKTGARTIVPFEDQKMFKPLWAHAIYKRSEGFLIMYDSVHLA